MNRLDYMNGSLHGGNYFISALLRFRGIGDVFGLVMREEAQRVREQLQQGGAE